MDMYIALICWPGPNRTPPYLSAVLLGAEQSGNQILVVLLSLAQLNADGRRRGTKERHSGNVRETIFG